MKKSQRLEIIVNLNAEKEKQALDQMGQAQRQRQQAHEQLASLKQYKQEYNDNYSSLGSTGINVTQLLEFRAFIDKLDKAISEQKQTIVDMDEKLSFTKMAWEQQHQKTTSLTKVCQSALAEEAKLDNMREQKEQDDRSSRTRGNSGTESVYN